MSQVRQELEREHLLCECHSLVALIGQSPYANKLLKAAKNGLLIIAGYKSNRSRDRNID